MLLVFKPKHSQDSTQKGKKKRIFMTQIYHGRFIHVLNFYPNVTFLSFHSHRENLSFFWSVGSSPEFHLSTRSVPQIFQAYVHERFESKWVMGNTVQLPSRQISMDMTVIYLFYISMGMVFELLVYGWCHDCVLIHRVMRNCIGR